MLGTDPEAFIIGPEHRPVPAHRLLPGKWDKKVLDMVGDKPIWAFRDGFAVELNVPPVHDPIELANLMAVGWRAVVKLLPERHYLSTRPTVPIIPEVDLKDAPEDVLQFGCDSSRCAYTGAVKRPELDGVKHRLRYAGCHMHFSAPMASAEAGAHKWMMEPDNHQLFIKLCDLFIGLPLTVIYRSTDQFRRREFYGQAGEYRIQDYGDALGLEYRTPPSNMMNHSALVRLFFTVGQTIFENFQRFADHYGPLLERQGEAIRLAINTGHRVTELVQPFEDLYTGHLIEKASREAIFENFQLPWQPVTQLGWTEWRNGITAR